MALFALTAHNKAPSALSQPLERISVAMVRLLVEVVEGGELAAVTLPTSLVLRASARWTRRGCGRSRSQRPQAYRVSGT